MRVRSLLEVPELGLRLLSGAEELDRRIRRVMVTDLSAPHRYLGGGELVLTGLVWHHGPDDSERFVRQLVAGEAAVLAAGEAERDAVPQDLVDACERHRLPLLAVPEWVAFASVSEFVGRRISAQRAGDLAAVLDRHRALMNSPDGAGLEPVLALLAGQLGLRTWVLTPTGGHLAGPTAEPSTTETGPAAAPQGESTEEVLPEQYRLDLARARLARVTSGAATGAKAPGARVRLHGDEGDAYTAFPVPESRPVPGFVPSARWQSLKEWFLLVEGDATDWAEEREQLVEELTRLVAAERDRYQARRQELFRNVDEALAALARDVPPGELAPLLRTAGCPLPTSSPGGQAESWKVLTVSAYQISPTVRHGRRAEGGPEPELLRQILDQALPGGLVGRVDDTVVALLPHPDGPRGCTGQRVRNLLAPLSTGLAAQEWIAVGISHPVLSVDALHGALDEASHARGIAESADTQTVRVSAPEDHATHMTLLAAVPDSVRRAFRERLLGQLRDYDARHHADLMPTLETFLECDGSWTRCASRLGIHVNSVRYRVGRIEELTGRDLSRLPDRVDLLLALRIG